MKIVQAAWTVVMLCLAGAAPGAETVGVVSHIKVLSDKVPDVSSLEAWAGSHLRPGMSDEQKALKIWETVVRFQHQDSPPLEYLQNENTVLDPIKMFNVYGYSFCSVAASHVQALARYAGLDARGWTLRAHVVPEVFWDNRWHLLDASLINYFPKPDGQIAGIEEVAGAVKAWLEEYPQYRGDDRRLREFQQADSWTGWLRGPALLTGSPFYDPSGWWPAGTHGWYATMQEYDGSTLFPYECGYSQGYQVNVQLRPGMRLIRNWSNQGLHVNLPGAGPGGLNGKVGHGALRYSPKFGDLAPGRVGNGRLEYRVPLGDAGLQAAALTYQNLAPRAAGELAIAEAVSPGVLELRIPSSYVYLGGTMDLAASVADDGQVLVLLSDNNGQDWQEIARLTASESRQVDLQRHIFRRYDYRLRLVLHGGGTALQQLQLGHDIQHSQRPLPALGQGKNQIQFSAGPREGTITIEGSTQPGNAERQLVYTAFHPQSSGLAAELLRVQGREGQITFPIETPGDMTRLRFGCFYRARDARDRWDLQVSFDDGQAFQTVAAAEGPHVFAGKWVAVEAPAGTRRALVRYAGSQVNTTCILNLRIDADYREPAGGFRPVKITYVWDEKGVEKRDTRVAARPEETYEIYCPTAPAMKSIQLELEE